MFLWRYKKISVLFGSKKSDLSRATSGTIISVGNPRDQMTSYTEFVTIFSSA